MGIGGSMTVKELGLADKLKAAGHTIYWHWLPDAPKDVHAKAQYADAYLCSSNAVTAEGQLVNIDGTGNRVASMFFGPKEVFILVG